MMSKKRLRVLALCSSMYASSPYSLSPRFTPAHLIPPRYNKPLAETLPIHPSSSTPIPTERADDADDADDGEDIEAMDFDELVALMEDTGGPALRPGAPLEESRDEAWRHIERTFDEDHDHDHDHVEAAPRPAGLGGVLYCSLAAAAVVTLHQPFVAAPVAVLGFVLACSTGDVAVDE